MNVELWIHFNPKKYLIFLIFSRLVFHFRKNGFSKILNIYFSLLTIFRNSMEDHVTQNFLCPIDDVRVRRPTNSSEVSFNKYFQPNKIKVYHRKTFFNEYKLVAPLSSETTLYFGVTVVFNAV